ncbi:MAG: GNAT family N-acetyltransferase [Gammaproteobacteria bacterium]
MSVSIRELRSTPRLRPWLDRAYAAWMNEIGAREASVAAAHTELDSALRSPGVLALIIERDQLPVGFALIRREAAGEEQRWRLLDFFVLAEMRRLGVGGAAARLLFDRFVGDWEIVTLSKDSAALHFWRRVLARHAPGRASETRGAGEIVQRFKSSGAR